MKKLNPLELPQVNSDELLTNMPPASTSYENNLGGRDEQPKPVRVEHEATQLYSSNPDLFNILLMEQQQNSVLNRPRQYGRRSDPVQLSSIAIDSSDIGAAVRLEKLR